MSSRSRAAFRDLDGTTGDAHYGWRQCYAAQHCAVPDAENRGDRR